MMTHEERVNKAAQHIYDFARNVVEKEEVCSKTHVRLYMKKLHINFHYNAKTKHYHGYIRMRVDSEKNYILYFDEKIAIPIANGVIGYNFKKGLCSLKDYEQLIQMIVGRYPQIFDKYYLNKVIKKSDYSQERSKAL